MLAAGCSQLSNHRNVKNKVAISRERAGRQYQGRRTRQQRRMAASGQFLLTCLISGFPRLLLVKECLRLLQKSTAVDDLV